MEVCDCVSMIAAMHALALSLQLGSSLCAHCWRAAAATRSELTESFQTAWDCVNDFGTGRASQAATVAAPPSEEHAPSQHSPQPDTSAVRGAPDSPEGFMMMPITPARLLQFEPPTNTQGPPTVLGKPTEDKENEHPGISGIVPRDEDPEPAVAKAGTRAGGRLAAHAV